VLKVRGVDLFESAKRDAKEEKNSGLATMLGMHRRRETPCELIRGLNANGLPYHISRPYKDACLPNGLGAGFVDHLLPDTFAFQD
jgi:hypothetical protein